MPSDRLAALRAQNNTDALPDAENGQAGYELKDIRVPSGTEGSMSTFFSTVGSLQDAIKKYDKNVLAIAELQSRSLTALDENASRQYQSELDALAAETRTLGNNLSKQIQQLTTWPVKAGDIQPRNNQIGLVKSKFTEALQRYQKVEQQHREKERERVARQFKIVKPNATPEETAAVVNEAGAGSNQIFAQAVSSSERYGQAREALEDTQTRQQALQRVEKTLSELVQLFNDMATLVLQQEETINHVEATASIIKGDVQEGDKQLGVAIIHALNARRGRQICFGIFLIIVIALGLGLGIYYGYVLPKAQGH
ncbi:t-SNARE [Athelia psychrophila]|uniref:t-SNARE n=1 Tax=Athelia psychrophila TaxID=1759441 RepID=A0A166N9X3_9AGAM|nr:t-SNARE [Fibularhizoctonia sp. CBS 109695]